MLKVFLCVLCIACAAHTARGQVTSLFYLAHISFEEFVIPGVSHALGEAQYELIDQFSLTLTAIPINAAGIPEGPPKPVLEGIAASTDFMVIAYDTLAWPENFYQHWLDPLPRNDSCMEALEECLPMPSTMTQEQRDFYFPLDPMPTW